MQVFLLNSDWDTFLVAALFLCLLTAGLFRLDALLAASKRREVPRQPSIGIDENGRRFQSDPDGRTRYFPRNSR